MNRRQSVLTICVTLAFLSNAAASPAVEGLLDEYRQQAAGVLILGWQVSSGDEDDRCEISQMWGRTPRVRQ